jgi:hypothetical protein
LVCQTILPDLDLSNWFAKPVPRFGLDLPKTVCQTIFLDLDLHLAAWQFDSAIGLAIQFGKTNSI